MFAARVPHARGAWERGSAAALSSRVGALVGSFARRWRTDPDVRQYEQRREAMAALGRAVQR